MTDVYHISNLEAVTRQYASLIAKGKSALDAKAWIRDNWNASGYLDRDDLLAIEAYYNERSRNRFNEYYQQGNFAGQQRF